MLTPPHPTPPHPGFGDLLRVGAVGLRTRKMRAFLSALGITIGIAATVVIGGIAGLYPAMRAARLSPTEALATL